MKVCNIFYEAQKESFLKEIIQPPPPHQIKAEVATQRRS